MEYNKAAGSFAKVDDIQDGSKVKLVGEVSKQVSRFKDADGNEKFENIGKARFKDSKEPVNVRLNWTTIYGLIDAFGKESKDWIDKVLTVYKREMLVGDTVRDVLYFVPEGFALVKNEEKKLEIRKKGAIEPPAEYTRTHSEEMDSEDVPF